ncbi:hypothetical protein EDD11_005012 [Mortierella claussenii]|nr:hypothetical protein EDD11_005012 [Mortierella claussenii]
MSQAPTPTCPTNVCSPPCKTGYVCSLSVIESITQCPVASCIKPGFDTGTGNNNDPPTSSKGSIVGPVLGAVAGLGIVAAIAFFVIRRRRRRRRGEAMMMLGQDGSLDSFSKRWHSENGESAGKDVIRIAYIPSVIGDSPIGAPQPSVQTGGVLKPNFTSLRNEDRSKHDSVASLDEAVVMAVTAKATPQVMKLNAIKATQSDLIQRSNTLHSSNSIKRSQSQRRLAETKKANAGGIKKPSPLGGSAQTDSDSDRDSEAEGVHHQTATLRNRRSSGLSSFESDQDNPFMTEAELASTTNVSSYTNNTQSSHATKVASRSSNPFLSIAESTVVGSSTGPNTPMSPGFSVYPSQPGTPMSDSTTVFTSMPISLSDHQPLDSDDPLAGLPAPNLRPWTSSSASNALRDSTFSTVSDSRSSTRGDGEEIMIFWDGQRDSKAI